MLSLLLFFSLSLRVFTLIYTISSFSSLSYMWTVDCLCWSLFHQHPPEIFGGSCKAEKYYSEITSSLMRPKSWVQSIQCGSSNFSIRYFWALIPLVRLQSKSLSVKLLERSPWMVGYTFGLCFVYPRRHSSSACLPQPFYSQSTHETLSLTASLLFIRPWTNQRPRSKPETQYIILGIYSYN